MIESKQPVPIPKNITRLCLRCSRKKETNQFHSNKNWIDQLGVDAWCKDCVAKCSTKEEMKEYFWENHRVWSESLWNLAKQKAEALVSRNPTYQNATADRKLTILDRITCQQVPLLMNGVGFYKYFDPGKEGKAISYVAAKQDGLIVEDDPNKKVFNKKFNGNFKKKELDFLEDFYERLSKEFDYSDVATEDVAKKMAKASLIADKAQDDFNAGRCDISVVRDAMAQYDMLSKSGNFAACKRKPKGEIDKGSFSEMVEYLETHGRPCIRKIEWEKDDVDMAINELRHIVKAIE